MMGMGMGMRVGSGHGDQQRSRLHLYCPKWCRVAVAALNCCRLPWLLASHFTEAAEEQWAWFLGEGSGRTSHHRRVEGDGRHIRRKVKREEGATQSGVGRGTRRGTDWRGDAIFDMTLSK